MNTENNLLNINFHFVLPNFVCNPCGIQLFVRKQHGIKLLDKLLRDAAKHELPFKQRAEQVYQLQALLTEINGVKEQIKRMEPQIGFLFWRRRQDTSLQLAETKLENLFKELEQLAKK